MKNLDSSVPFQAIFEHSSIGIIVSNAQGIMKQVNPFAAQIFGYSVDELVGQKIEVLLPLSLREKHVFQREGYCKDPSPRAMGSGMDLMALRKDNIEFPVEISLSSYKLNDELLVVSFINDITERKKIKKKLKEQALQLESKVEERTKELSHALLELNHSNESLQLEVTRREEIETKVRDALKKEQELNELKSRFVSMASHEFRTPLGGILTSASLLGKYNLIPNSEEKREKHIRTIKKAVRNLTMILNDFLSLDKLEQGKTGATPSSFELVPFIKTLINETKDMSEEGQHIEYQHIGDDITVYQDKDMLRNILTNLLSNAMKYSPLGSAITVVSKNKDSNIEISVRDEGMGIPEEDQKHLFERFFRAHNVTTIQGTGLGLNIVKRYLDLMGGQISFESQKDIGTTFTVVFPSEKRL